MAIIHANELRSNLNRSKEHLKNGLRIIKSPYSSREFKDALRCNGLLFKIVNDESQFIRCMSVRDLNKHPVIKSVIQKMTETMKKLTI